MGTFYEYSPHPHFMVKNIASWIWGSVWKHVKISRRWSTTPKMDRLVFRAGPAYNRMKKRLEDKRRLLVSYRITLRALFELIST